MVNDAAIGGFAYCCTFPAIIISVFYVNYYFTALQSLNDFPITTGDKFLIDWNTPLISDIYVKDKKDRCDGTDEPVIHMPWFGQNHMCISKSKKKAYRGFSCDAENMLYRAVGKKTKTQSRKVVRTIKKKKEHHTTSMRVFQ